MKYDLDAYLERRYRQTERVLQAPLEHPEEHAAWLAAFRSAFTEKLGFFFDKVPLNPEVLEETKENGYTRRLVLLNGGEDLPIPAYVLVPDGVQGPLPTVVALHGHGAGVRPLVGLHPDGASCEDDPGYHNCFAVQLCRRGMLVIAPELAGFGMRRLHEDADQDPYKSSCLRITCNLLAMGTTLAALRIWDATRCLDYLAECGLADMARVGVMGISGGGTVATFTAALDDRIKAAVVSGYFNTFHDSILAMHHCPDNFVPGMLRLGEMPDYFCAIAPRPLLIESGALDDIYPQSGVQAAFPQMERMYGQLSARERLELHVFPSGHEVNGERAYPFLERWLGVTNA